VIQKYNHRSKKVVMTGLSGTGKTTLFFSTVKSENAKWKFVYDSQGEFSDRFGLEPVSDREGLLQATAKGGWICFDPINSFEDNPEEGLMWYCDFVFTACGHLKGRKLLVIDELDDLTQDIANPKELLRVFRRGRRLEIDVYAICQGTNALHNRVRQQITDIYAFAQGDENATKWLVSRGLDEEKLLGLKPGEYLYKNRNSAEVKEGGKAF
jgi:hypothetical protein